jgi:hypothetical protein
MRTPPVPSFLPGPDGTPIHEPRLFRLYEAIDAACGSQDPFGNFAKHALHSILVPASQRSNLADLVERLPPGARIVFDKTLSKARLAFDSSPVGGPAR